MKAVVVDEDNGLHWQDFETAVANPDEVLIKVHATAINRADLMQRQGFYPPPPGASQIMGLECAGEIVAIGGNCSRFAVGDRVCALLAGGGYAQYATAHEGSVLPIPGGLSFAEAASLPEVFATAWLNLFIEAGLQPGEKVILHAGASGVGTAAIQLCKSFGSPSFITAGSDDKIDSLSSWVLKPVLIGIRAHSSTKPKSLAGKVASMSFSTRSVEPTLKII